MTSPGAAAPAAPKMADEAARRALLTGLAMALQLLAAKVQPHGDTARQVAAMAAQAEELATEAWNLSVARMPDPSRANGLAAAFREFIAEAAELSDRAARAAAGSREVAATMHKHASELDALGRGFDTVVDAAALRATLRPLAASLETLPAKLQAGLSIAEDVAELGTRATSLVAQAEPLEKQARNPAQAAVAAYRGLREFADAASTIAKTMLEDSEKVRGAISGLAARATQIASPAAAAEAQRKATADGRLHEIVKEGREAAVAPRAAIPAKGIAWTAPPRTA